jgi:hypothetical protein
MHEAILVPQVEPGSNTRNISAVRLLDRRTIGVVVQHHRVEDMPAVVDEVHAVLCHRASS